MKTENLYTMTTEMVRQYAAAAGLETPEKLLQDPASFTRCGITFYENAAAILAGCLEDMGKKKPGAMPAMKRIIKAANVATLQGIFPHNGHYVLCDGKRAIRLAEDVPALPHVENSLNITDLFRPCIIDDPGRIFAPDLAALKAHAAENKKEKYRPQPFILAGYIGVNAAYLLDLLAVLENPVIYLPDNNTKPLYIKGSNGDAILCPVNIGQRLEYGQTMQAAA